MKKITALLLGLVLVLAFQAGSAFADSKLNGFINDVIGSPYKSGGTTSRGFDCSGFTSYVFDKMGIELPRTSGSQAKSGSKVAKADLIPGDLVFFDTVGGNNSTVSHVGIYIGDGKFAHSSSSRGVVTDKLSSSYYEDRYVTARRVMDADSFQSYADAQ
ncbi:cell wall-associated NlpC family hydrolase [Paenibacillus endophyticus]|uniref:Cell wall-associated NlpC family hydrolase n=1 Tax=Paenibacillus endophyticus TaxID=1294268 RepID=A0A7W5CE33_9BACL|nr:C40 family peptidase [Paenibacillus endophyticus]MBB3155986.1 cell wall-associated NlpC family hydrolase [Paenibacillus endophyticus]